jgi:hypothetical protein
MHEVSIGVAAQADIGGGMNATERGTMTPYQAEAA